MYVERETAKGLLMNLDAVSFWIQKRWLRADGSLTPSGWKAFHIAKREYARHLGFDALREFAAVRETDKAVLLRCLVQLPDGREAPAEFWLPKAMTDNWNFVAGKIREIEGAYPFIGTYVRWSGGEVQG